MQAFWKMSWRLAALNLVVKCGIPCSTMMTLRINQHVWFLPLAYLVRREGNVFTGVCISVCPQGVPLLHPIILPLTGTMSLLGRGTPVTGPGPFKGGNPMTGPRSLPWRGGTPVTGLRSLQRGYPNGWFQVPSRRGGTPVTGQRFFPGGYTSPRRVGGGAVRATDFASLCKMNTSRKAMWMPFMIS